MLTTLAAVSTRLYEIAAELRNMIVDDEVFRMWQRAEIQQAIHDLKDIAHALANRSL